MFPNSWLLFRLLINMSWIVFFQAMNLGSGKLMHNIRVLYTHPKTNLISFNDTSAFDFDGSIISSLGTGSFLR